MSPGKIWMTKCARFMLLLIPAVALAMPAYAFRDPRLYDSQEPGSVIVFAKFLRGVVVVDGTTLPKTEFEVGIVCPHHSVATPAGPVNVDDFCAEHQPVKIRFSWVCPAFEGFDSQICHQNNFDVFGTVNGKLVFDPENLTITGSNSVNVATPPCPMGYLIGYVIAPNTDQPVKFDGLIGDEVIRESPTAVSAFNAIPIQAANEFALNYVSGVPTGDTLITEVLDPLSGLPMLSFDGADNHYKAVSGTIIGDVKFTNDPPSPALPIRSASFLTLLTLDVRSNWPNDPIEVNINWWNESNALSPTSPLFEKLLSTSFEFICWTEIPLTSIDPNLTQSQMGTRKGVFRSTKATKFPINGIFDFLGPVTLLGTVETLEGPSLLDRSYFYPAYNNSDVVKTFFLHE